MLLVPVPGSAVSVPVVGLVSVVGSGEVGVEVSVEVELVDWLVDEATFETEVPG